jgi:hypothetical protein
MNALPISFLGISGFMSATRASKGFVKRTPKP